MVILVQDCKGKGRISEFIVNIERDYSEALLRPSYILPRSPSPPVDNLVDGKEEESRSRSKSVKFADLPKFFN